MGSQQEPEHKIVVGVDGSASSKAALAWAVRQAELTGATVEAVIAWHRPAMVGGVPFAPIEALDTTDYAGFASKVLSDAVADTVPPDTLVAVSSAVRAGSPAQELLDASEGADLLVLGNRGHGGFAGALLGSVGEACVHHARCPVVIVRDPARAHGRTAAQSG